MVRRSSMFASGAGGTLPVRRNSSAKLGPGSSAGENRGRVIGRGGYPLRMLVQLWCQSPGIDPEFDRGGRLLAALLDVGLHELLGVHFEHLVDFVEEVVELRFY